MNGWKVADLPDDALPGIDDLGGDMRILADLVGVRLALAISELFDGTPGRFYGHRKWLRRWRDASMRREYDAGAVTVVDLARKYHLSERQTYNVLGIEPGEDRQLRLF